MNARSKGSSRRQRERLCRREPAPLYLSGDAAGRLLHARPVDRGSDAWEKPFPSPELLTSMREVLDQNESRLGEVEEGAP